MSPTRTLAAFGAVLATVGVVTGLVTFTIAYLVGNMLLPGTVPDVSSYFAVATALFLLGASALAFAFASDQVLTMNREPPVEGRGRRHA